MYLPVYYLAMGSDWLQGPYCYKLYSSYGFPPREVGYLFVAGYASSALMGSCVGGLTDRIGRKRMALAYAFLYGFSAVLKAREEFWVLMAGRIISGVSYVVTGFSLFFFFFKNNFKNFTQTFFQFLTSLLPFPPPTAAPQK